MKETFSYHIFLFPFKWSVTSSGILTFSEQTGMNRIHFREGSYWRRQFAGQRDEDRKVLYNEKNYYYKFVHDILYDSGNDAIGLIRHFERFETRECGSVQYIVKIKNRPEAYVLDVDAMNLNLYATGVGCLTLHLRNTNPAQREPQDILNINQFGRRIMPPFIADIEGRNELSEYICIDGLLSADGFREDFTEYTPDDSWKHSPMLDRLIGELADNIRVEPVVDDRMYVMSWYKNDELSKAFTKDIDAYHKTGGDFADFWYRYVFVDSFDVTCQDENMMAELLKKSSYVRWQRSSSLYGVSRYSFVYLTNSGAPQYLLDNFETMYARMTELVLVQRASMLRFSGEVTKLSRLLDSADIKKISGHISSLYREYIRFINQIYFREVSAQDQGIEIYAMLQDALRLPEYVKDLDGEIGELHQYISLREDRTRDEKAQTLNKIATVLLPVSLVTGLWGMNNLFRVGDGFWGSFALAVAIMAVFMTILLLVINHKKKEL